MNNKLIQGNAYSHTISHKRGITAEVAESAGRGARDWGLGVESKTTVNGLLTTNH